MGFTQALLMSGTRSVCLSLWKVDDQATALLMQRFYANYCSGHARRAQANSMRKARLAEAKEWLRGLKVNEDPMPLSAGEVVRQPGAGRCPPFRAPALLGGVRAGR